MVIKKRAEINMSQLNRNSQKAFTLIEIVIYGALVTIIIGVLVLTSVNILTARAKITAIEEVSHNARFAFGRVVYEIRQAEEIKLPLPGNTAASLELIDPEGDKRTFHLDVEGKALQITIGDGGLPFSLTNDSVIVEELKFTNVSYSNETPGTIRIEMTIKFNNPLERPEWDFERVFYATENIRR